VTQSPLILWCLLLIFLQVVHIFEEIAGEAYELAGSLGRYLRVASVLVAINVAFLALIVAGVRVGYYLGLLGAAIAILNGLVHLVGYARTGTFRRGIGAGLFTGIPLSAVGVIVLSRLIAHLSV
jgi:hypothetical protein